MYTQEEVTGEIQMGVSYSDTDTLKVSINKVRGLTPPNKIDENHTNPYVTLSISKVRIVTIYSSDIPIIG